jgi:outer membrane protein assembly factor BamE
MPAIFQRRPWLLAAAVAATLALGACSGFTERTRGALAAVTPYKVEVVQGNFVSKEQVAALKPGMSRQQVREILGTSLLNDVFHSNRWDYVFTIRRQGTEPQRRSIVAVFDGDVLKSIDTPEVPEERAFVASINTFKAKDIPILALTEEQRKALPVPPKPAAAASEPEGPVRDYPPLEPAAAK